MASTKAVVLLGFCVVLATAKPAADTPLNLFSTVEQQTTAANKTLAGLPAACTRDSARSIQEAKIKVLGDVIRCSVFTIINDIGYTIIDVSNYANITLVEGVAVMNAVKACNDTDILNRVLCWDAALSNSDAAVVVINNATTQFVNLLNVAIPKMESDISACQKKSALQYEQFLDDLVKKAKTC